MQGDMPGKNVAPSSSIKVVGTSVTPEVRADMYEKKNEEMARNHGPGPIVHDDKFSDPPHPFVSNHNVKLLSRLPAAVRFSKSHGRRKLGSAARWQPLDSPSRRPGRNPPLWNHFGSTQQHFWVKLLRVHSLTRQLQ